MPYKIQVASANNVYRHDNTLNSPNWETIAIGNTPRECLEVLLRSANDEEFDIANSWLRLVENDSKVVTF